MDAQAGANTPGWLHSLATRLEQASTDVLEKKMTDKNPTPEQVAEAISDVKRIRGTVGADGSEDYHLAENVLIEAATALATVTAERDQARQMLADAEQNIASMELDASLREEDERFADPL
jgi:hypothetical protein